MQVCIDAALPPVPLMCGITGFVNLDSPDRLARLQAMISSLSHRGPDDRGHFLDEEAGIGMTRLSIIDLAGGHQPKSAAGGTLQIVFNGEIYNYRELRRQLVGLGHQFTSESDSEVIARAFEQWSEDAFPRMHGMFAIAVWDTSARRLTLARDPVGKKPLYLWHSGVSFAFASELKAFQALRPLPELDRQAFVEYLHFGYVPGPRSIWTGIEKLDRGHVAVFEDGELHKRAFSDFTASDPVVKPKDAVAELDELVDRAVQRRLIADVDVGILLSGGVDSSIVAWKAAAKHPAIHSFTVAFDDRDVDESVAARAFASLIGTTHHERLVTGAEAVAIVESLPQTFDEPFADASAVPTLLISRFASQHVKVVLGGDGGDELFSGYRRYRSFERMRRAQAWVPPVLRRVGAPLSRSSLPLVRRTGSFLDKLGTSDASTYMNLCGLLAPTVLTELLGGPPDLSDVLARFERDFAGPADSGPRIADLRQYLPDDILVKVDRASMSTGLEVRAPLLDVELVQWSARLHPDCLGRPGSKSLPRALLASQFPGELSQRPKQGFSVPLPKWLNGPFRPQLKERLSKSELAKHGLLDPIGVASLVRRLESGNASAAAPLWALLMFQFWHEHWVERVGVGVNSPGLQHPMR